MGMVYRNISHVLNGGSKVQLDIVIDNYTHILGVTVDSMLTYSTHHGLN